MAMAEPNELGVDTPALPRLSDRVSVLLGQGAQLLQREPPRASRLGYHDAGPHAFGAGRRARFLGASPPKGADTTQGFGALVGRRGPSVRVPGARGLE